MTGAYLGTIPLSTVVWFSEVIHSGIVCIIRTPLLSHFLLFLFSCSDLKLLYLARWWEMKQARNMMLDRARRRRIWNSVVWGRLGVEIGEKGEKNMAFMRGDGRVVVCLSWKY